MFGGIRIRLLEEEPMPPTDSDFSLKIEFQKSRGDAARVFEAASAFIRGFEEFDRAIIGSIDSEISPLMVLEDVESGSIRIFLKNLLTRADDDALKGLDWKPAVGKYLVKAKYLTLEWLDSNPEKGTKPSIEALSNGIKKLAEETDARHLPDYPRVHEARLTPALDKLQGAKSYLTDRDRIYIETEGKTYQVDLSQQWKPSEYMLSGDEDRDEETVAELVLTVRKPDFIGNTKWQFQHGRASITAAITDSKWLRGFHNRDKIVMPKDALRCKVKFSYTITAEGEVTDEKTEITEVVEIITNNERQKDLLDDS